MTRDVTKPRISVAMCTYNGSPFIVRQLDSILRQSRSPNEIVICDDDSTDSTWEVLQEFHSRYPERIKIFHNDRNLGPAKSFEKAISLCAGDFIALSDQDDVWRQDKLEVLARKLEQASELDLVFSNAQRIDAEGNRLGRDLWQIVGFNQHAKAGIRKGSALKTLLRKPLVTGCTTMFRSRLRTVCLPVEKPMMHDYWISLIAAACSRMDYVDEKLVLYRQHIANEVGAPTLSLKQRIDRACWLGVLECRQDASGLEKLIKHLVRSGSVNEYNLNLISQKVAFLKKRLELWSEDTPFFRRVVILSQNLLRGEYGRWSNGWPTVTKDLALLLGVVRRSTFPKMMPPEDSI